MYEWVMSRDFFEFKKKYFWVIGVYFDGKVVCLGISEGGSGSWNVD